MDQFSTDVMAVVACMQLQRGQQTDCRVDSPSERMAAQDMEPESAVCSRVRFRVPTVRYRGSCHGYLPLYPKP